MNNNNNNNSGRIQISKGLPPKSYEEPPKMSVNNKHKNLKNVSSNLLNKTFFSSKNIEIIQNNIRTLQLELAYPGKMC